MSNIRKLHFDKHNSLNTVFENTNDNNNNWLIQKRLLVNLAH